MTTRSSGRSVGQSPVRTKARNPSVDVVKLLPPLIISEADAKWFLTAFEDVMLQMHKFPGPAGDVLTGIGKMAITQRAR